MHIELMRHAAFDVRPLQAELAAHPSIWNEHRMRTRDANSPHREASDIWVRFLPVDDLLSNHEQLIDWYPVAQKLPTAKDIARNLMDEVRGIYLGGILITRIPPGKQVYPHIDRGWHARTFEKFAVQIKGNDHQGFHFDEKTLITRDGDLFTFDNAFPHWVTNNSDEDRITLIVCIRRH